jgi:hypothetical protein
VTGAIYIFRDGDEVDDAAVTVNGGTVPPGVLPGAYAIGANVSGEMGGVLSVCASDGVEAGSSFSVPCIPPIEITSPTEDTSVAEGETITISWSGNIDIDDAVSAPGIAIRGFDLANEAPSNGFNELYLGPGDSIATIVVPETVADGYLLSLNVGGQAVRDGVNAGSCGIHYRVHLTKR